MVHGGEYLDQWIVHNLIWLDKMSDLIISVQCTRKLSINIHTAEITCLYPNLADNPFETRVIVFYDTKLH